MKEVSSQVKTYKGFLHASGVEVFLINVGLVRSSSVKKAKKNCHSKAPQKQK